VLLHLADSTHGSHDLLYFSPAVEIIVNSIDSRDLEEFAAALNVLLPVLFLNHTPSLLEASLQWLSVLIGRHSPYRIFADVFNFTNKQKKKKANTSSFLWHFWTDFTAAFRGIFSGKIWT
jgi:hypothetical protein